MHSIVSFLCSTYGGWETRYEAPLSDDSDRYDDSVRAVFGGIHPPYDDYYAVLVDMATLLELLL